MNAIPSTAASEELARLVVRAAMFFELADDDTVDPDAAVDWLESIASSLEQLSPADRDWLLGRVGDWATEEKQPENRRFLEAFPDAFGLVADGGEEDA